MNEAQQLLSALFDAGDPVGWCVDAWGREPRRARFEAPPSVSAEFLDELLSAGAITYPQATLLCVHRSIDPGEYTYRHEVAGIEMRGVDPDQVRLLMAEGATIQLKRIERHHHDLGCLIEQLEEELGCLVSVNAFISPAGGCALPTHTDPNATVVLQVAGRKLWEIGRFAGTAGRLLRTPWTLDPGDAIYLPAGWAHRAIAKGPSVSLSFAISEFEGTTVAWTRRGLDVSPSTRTRFAAARLARDRIGLAALFR